MSAEDKRLLVTASRVAMQVADQLGRQGATVEDAWLVVALAARALERAVIDANRHVNNVRPYAVAQEQLKRLLVVSDAATDVTESVLATEDGVSPPLRS